MALPELDNHDGRIRYYELMLEADIGNMPEIPLPDGYAYAFYQDGDRDAWIEIEKSAKEFSSYEQGLEAWKRYYEERTAELPGRMVFVINPAGKKVATATAFYDIRGIDRSGAGWLHWVAVRREEQGKGLSKPLISHVIQVMKDLGYRYAKIPTQTTTWLACKVYLDLGFRPIQKNYIRNRDGWRIIKRLTDHPALAELDAAADDEVLKVSCADMIGQIKSILPQQATVVTQCDQEENVALRIRKNSEKEITLFFCEQKREITLSFDAWQESFAAENDLYDAFLPAKADLLRLLQGEAFIYCLKQNEKCLLTGLLDTENDLQAAVLRDARQRLDDQQRIFVCREASAASCRFWDADKDREMALTPQDWREAPQMTVDILTVFPEMFDSVLNTSIIGRARQQGLIEIETADIRPFSSAKHKNTDDYPFGGGAGMLMMAQPIADCMKAVCQKRGVPCPDNTRPDAEPSSVKRIYLSPRGVPLTQKLAQQLAKEKHLILLCGHYEGVDQRALDKYIDMEVSIGDYVLTGGELSAMVLFDCVARLIPGVLGSEESPQDESFSDDGLLEYPQYTRPREFEGMEVPPVLLNGDHAKITAWRREQAILTTAKRRPDLLPLANLTAKERKLAEDALEGKAPD